MSSSSLSKGRTRVEEKPIEGISNKNCFPIYLISKVAATIATATATTALPCERSH